MATSKDYVNLRARKLSQEELKSGVKAMAKVANQRLLQLEKASISESSPAYQYIQKEIEKGNIKEFAKVNKAGNVRFSVEKKLDKAQLQAEYEKLQGFLKTKTSKVAQAKNFIETGRKQMKINTDTGLSTKEIGEIWNEALIRNFYKSYGYSEFNRITKQAENFNLSPEDISKALEYAGFNSNSTDETKPSLQEIEKAFKEWKDLQKDEEREEKLTLPEEL